MERAGKIVVVGASGQLGSDVVAALGGLDVSGVDHASVDLERPASLSAMLARFRPEVVVNAAAFANVERCETHPELAFAVNATGVDALALACSVAGAALLHVSTDYVFGGDSAQPYAEDDVPAPCNVYGVSKLAGEQAAKARLERVWIVRTSGLYGLRGSSTKGYTFIERVLSQARAGQPVRVVDDITFSPSYTAHVARTIRAIIERAPFGTYHATNSGACTWFDFAAEAFAQAGIVADLQRTTSDRFPTYAKRPRNSALSMGALAKAGIATPPSWKDGVRDYLAAKAGVAPP